MKNIRVKYCLLAIVIFVAAAFFTADAEWNNALTPHKATHVNGTDDIQNATAAQKGLATAAQITKLDGIEALADVTDATNVDAAGATMNTDADVSGNTWVLDEDNMVSNSAAKVPTQQSVKAYADTTFAPVAKGVTNGDSHDHSGGDGAAIPDAALSSGATVASAGVGDSGKLVKLDAAGHVDATAVNDADIDHTNIGSVGSNTHAQIDTHISTANPHSGSAASGANSDITSLSALSTPLSVAQGGTGAGTLTDGGILLGSGTDPVTAMAVLADGEFVVGDGTTDPVAESGATLRTSIGVGTGDTPQFTGLNLTTGELTAGSINRASGTLTLEIGGTAELSISSTTSTFGGNIVIPNSGTIGSVGDTDAITIDSSGNVGVGGAPAAKFDVDGGGILVTAAGKVDATMSLQLQNSDGSNRYIIYDNGLVVHYSSDGSHIWGFRSETDGSYSIVDWSSTQTRVSIQENGNVGIGTTDLDGTPAIGRLTVKGSTADGSTNIFVGRDSAEANVATIDTDGNAYFAGNVGVGTPGAPTSEIGIDAFIELHGSGHSGIIFSNNANTTDWSVWGSSTKFYISEDTTARVVVDTGGNVGVGVASPDSTLHVHTATAGTVAPEGTYDDLVVENSTHSGITILSPDAQSSGIHFGSPSQTRNAEISAAYGSGTPYLSLRVGDTPSMQLYASGKVFIADSANANAGQGSLTITGAASNDSEHITVKNADISHAITDISEADTFYFINKLSDTLGGARQVGISDDDATGIRTYGIIGVANPTDTVPAVVLMGAKRDGVTAGIAALASAERIGEWSNAGTAKWYINGNGMVTMTVAAGTPNFKLTATSDTPSSSPETDAETGWIEIDVGGTSYYIPYYN